MFSATAGLFFLWEQAQRTPNLTTTTTAAGASSNSTITVNAHTLALAPYAEVTTHLGEKFDVILGARYSYERRALKNYLNGAPRVNASASFRNVDYRATAQYKFSRQLQVYATASTGFKSGVFNTSAFDGNAVRPEKVKAYEVGFKSSTGPIKLSGDVFYYDYRDIQVTLSVDPRTGQSGLQNAARAHIKGAEFEAQGRIVDGLTANLGATYLHAVYKSFPGAQILIPIAGGGNANGTMDASGQPVVRSPKLTLTAGLNYETAFAGGLVNFNGSFYHTSSFTYEPSARVIQPAYDLLNGSIGWSPVNKKFGLTVYAENITKKRYYENLTINTTGDIAVYAPPRRIGVRLNFSL
jgi:iron complex outermembrane receptor protein